MSNNAKVGDLVVERNGWLCILVDTSVFRQEAFREPEVYDLGLSIRPVVGKQVKLRDYRSVISLADLLKLAEAQGFDFTYRLPEPELTESQKQAAAIEKLTQEIAALKAAAQAK